MGFFSNPGLGFASTVGAFIGGAARGANEQFAEERKEKEQDKVLQQAWAAKADKAISDWNKENKDLQIRATLFNQLKQRFGGDEFAADQAMAFRDSNPKASLADIINTGADMVGKGPSNYKSGYLSDRAEEAANRAKQVEQIKNNVSPAYRRFLSDIDQPNFGPKGQQQNQTPFQQPGNFGGGSNTPFQPQGNNQGQGQPTFSQVASTTPSVTGQGPANQEAATGPTNPNAFSNPSPQPQSSTQNFNPASPLNTPNRNMAPTSNVPAPSSPTTINPPAATGPNSADLQPGQTKNPASPDQYVPQGQPQGNGPLNLPPASPGNPMSTPAQINQPQASGPLNQTPSAPNQANPQTVTIGPLTMTADDAAYVKSILGDYPDKPKFGVLDSKILNAQKAWKIEADKILARRQDSALKANPPAAKGLDIMSDDAKKYENDPKIGLRARYADMANLAQQKLEVSSMTDILNRGFKANSLQDARDGLSKTIYAFGMNPQDIGIDWAKYGNSVQDINTMQKDVSNNLISRLQGLHFGRITNYEAGILGKGFANTANDPDTNLKITLIQQSLIQKKMDALKLEYNTYTNSLPKNLGPMDSVTPSQYYNARQNAENSVAKFYADYDTAHPETPWPQVNFGPQTAPAERQKTANQFNDQWIENKFNGKMAYAHNGRLYPAGTNIYGLQ